MLEHMAVTRMSISMPVVQSSQMQNAARQRALCRVFLVFLDKFFSMLCYATGML